jgi:hypothetical protein
MIRYRAGRPGRIVVPYLSPDPRSSTMSMGKATAGGEALQNGGKARTANYRGGAAKARAVLAGKAGQIARHCPTPRALLRGQPASG